MAGPTTAASAPRSSATIRSSVVVSAWTLVSRLSGLLRVVVIGAVMGPTFFANIFQAGYVVPSVVYSSIAGPVLAMVLVPALVRAIGEEGVASGRRVFGNVFGCLMTFSAAASVLLIALAPVIARTLTFGIPEPEQARAHELTTILVLLLAPQVPLFAMAGLGAAAQQARRRFALPAGAPAVENLGTTATVVLTGLVFGTGLQVQQAPVELVVLLGVGGTLAVAVHAALQLFGAAHCGFVAAPVLRWWRDPQAREFARRMGRSFGVAACPAAVIYVLVALAGTVPGGVLVVQLAVYVFYGLSYLGARAVAMAALPGLASAATDRGTQAFAAAWRQGLCYGVAASLPMLTLLVVFAAPVADVLANGEMRTAAVITQLAACLAVVAVAQLVGGVHDLGRQALFAHLDERGPRLAGVVALGAALAVAAAAMAVPAGGLRLVVLTLAILAGESAAATTVLVRLRRVIGAGGMLDLGTLSVVVVAALAMVPVALAGRWTEQLVGAGRLGELVLLAVAGLAAVGVYAVALRARLGRLTGAPR